MTKHFHSELETVKKKILSLSAIVEERVDMAVKTILDMDGKLAAQIRDTDFEIDQKEVEIEEDCLKIIALHQPVAVDLRFLIAVIKINNDLERIGDQAVNIAERVAVIDRQNRCNFAFDYTEMAETAQTMLTLSLDALIHLDATRAYDVLAMDDDVDCFQDEAYDAFKIAMQENCDCLGFLLNFFLISRHLERLADHATNIAEEVIHLIDGEIIRHQPHPSNKKK
ncbi:phosphate signaling complex protein PhoU [bacterium]|nr:phosphate signaling complex protein PhoU [bacterium]